jgi:hypothetical protein
LKNGDEIKIIFDNKIIAYIDIVDYSLSFFRIYYNRIYIIMANSIALDDYMTQKIRLYKLYIYKKRI